MDYGIIQPPKQLADYVRFYWFIEGNLPYVHHAFAYPCPELIFCYKGDFKYSVGLHAEQTLTSGIFGQAETFSRVVLDNKNFGILGVYLYPHAFLQLFNVPANELTNQHADIKSLLGMDGQVLEEQIMQAGNTHQRVKLVSDFLRARLKNVKTEHTAISSSIKTILKAHQGGSIKALADNNFLSLRQFERRFKELSGFNPKLFLRIMRFNSVLNKGFLYKSLTEIGMECGYYDQSHFIHDFQQFSGLSPKEYFRKETVVAADRGTVEF